MNSSRCSYDKINRVSKVEENIFLGTYHLIGEHEHRLERELSLAVVEQVLKRRPQQINDHHVVVSFDAEPVDVWDPNCNQDKTLDNQISQNS